MNFMLASEFSQFSFEELCSDEIEIVSGGSGGGGSVIGSWAWAGGNIATMAGGFGGIAYGASGMYAAYAAAGVTMAMAGPGLIVLAGAGAVAAGAYYLFS